MASTLHKLVISILGYCNLSMPLLKQFIENPPHKYIEVLCRFNQYSLMFHSVYIQVKFCSYNPSSNFNFYLWNGVLLFQQPLYDHYVRLLQLCKVANTLHKLPQPCINLITTLQIKLQQGCYNLVISIWALSLYSQCVVLCMKCVLLQ